MNRRIYVISGPSGVGKTPIIKILRQKIERLGYSIPHPSRKPRNQEKNGKDYHFVDRGTFEKMAGEGAFVEWAEVYGDLYGTSFKGLQSQLDQGDDVILDIDNQGAGNIKAHFKESILIYVLPPSLEELQRRLKHRATDQEDAIRKRIDKAEKEIQDCHWYDYLVINDALENAIKEIESIIIAENCRKSQRLPIIKQTFNLKTSP